MEENPNQKIIKNLRWGRRYKVQDPGFGPGSKNIKDPFYADYRNKCNNYLTRIILRIAVSC